MSRLGWLTSARTEQLLRAAQEGNLHYDPAGTLRHRREGGSDRDPSATTGDAQIVADLVTAGRLRREESGPVTVPGGPPGPVLAGRGHVRRAVDAFPDAALLGTTTIQPEIRSRP